MLRRVARGGRFSRRHPGEPQSPFDTPANGRPLRLIIDLTTCPPCDALDVLRAFGHHPSVEILEYHGRTVASGECVKPAPRDGPAELRLGVIAETSTDRVQVEVLSDRRVETCSAGEQQVVWKLAKDAGVSPVDEAARALALCWATDALGYDALVTGSSAILGELHENFVARGNPVSPTTGCELLGLFLRARDDYTIEIGESHSAKCDRSTFFGVLAREQLPESWRWFSACMRSSPGDPFSEIVGLGMSAMERYERALWSRDRLHVVRQLGDSPNVVDDEILAFDVLLLMLSAAFDVTALVASRAYDLQVDDRSVGWRRPSWRRHLRGADPTLFALTEPGTPAHDAMDLVAHMRNMVHGDALRVDFLWRGSPRQHRVRVPGPVAERLIATAAHQGGPEAFGLEEGVFGLYVDPVTFGERAFALATKTLNTLMAGTDVERLVTDPAVLLTGPPEREPARGFWDDDWHRARYRLLAGM